jgi:hypothetical protein
MSTTTVNVGTGPMPSPNPPGSKLNSILQIINLVLQALSGIPGLGVPIAIEQVFQRILTNALAAYQAETGQPLDLTKIPQETLVP